MAGNLYMTVVAGAKKLLAALQTSAGAGSAGNLVALGSTGIIDYSMLPPTGYEIHFVVNSISAAASSTFYCGSFLALSGLTTSAASAYSSVLQAGNIVACEYQLYSHTNLITGATFEIWNLTTGAVITATVQTATTTSSDTTFTFLITGISAAVAAGDKLQFRFITPSGMSTTTVNYAARIFIK